MVHYLYSLKQSQETFAGFIKGTLCKKGIILIYAKLNQVTKNFP